VNWLTYRDKSEVENTPDDVEAPLQASDAGRCDFNDHEVEDPLGVH
jgi:hypothetical protein